MNELLSPEAKARNADDGAQRRASRASTRDARLVLLFFVGVLLINFPVLAIFNRDAALGGIPIVYLYLFGVWVAGIAGVVALVGRHQDEQE